MYGWKAVNNWKQKTIQKSENMHYHCCIQPWKSYIYYLVVMLLVTNHCKVRHTAENKFNLEHIIIETCNLYLIILKVI
jgi:hypothetical protein